MNREALANLRFGVHSGFKTDIAALPKSAQTQTSRLFGWISMEAQDRFTLSRNGFQESASLLSSSKCPSSKSLPTHLNYSQRNDASGNCFTSSFCARKSNLLDALY